MPADIIPSQADRLANLKNRADLLRREGAYSGVWFADALLEAADDLDLLHQKLTAPSPVDHEGRARELLIEACHYCGIKPPPGHVLLAPFNEESLPWLVAIAALVKALSEGTGR